MTCCIRLEIQTENSQVSGKIVSFLAKSVLNTTKRNSINMDFVISLSPAVVCENSLFSRIFGKRCFFKK
jgi:hypothetical protein